MREDPKEVKKRTKLMDKGKEQRQKGKSKDAVKTFRKVSKRWSGFPLAHVSLGELYLADGNLEDAEVEFRAATSGDGQHYVEQLRGLAEVFRRQGKEEERADALRMAREAQPLRMYMGKGQATGKLAGVWTNSTDDGVLLLFSDSGPEIVLRFTRDYWPVVDSRVTVEFSGGNVLSIVDSRGVQQIERPITSSTLTRVLEGAMESAPSFFKDMDPTLVTSLEKTAQRQLGLKPPPTQSGFEMATKRFQYKMIIEYRMMMLLPFYELLKRSIGKDPLEIDERELQQLSVEYKETHMKETGDTESWIRFIACQVYLNRSGDAKSELESCISANPHDSQILWMLGGILIGIGNLREASEVLKSATQLDSSNELLSRYQVFATLMSHSQKK